MRLIKKELFNNQMDEYDSSNETMKSLINELLNQLHDSFVNSLENITCHVCQCCCEAKFLTEYNADELCSLCTRDADGAFKFSYDNISKANT